MPGTDFETRSAALVAGYQSVDADWASRIAANLSLLSPGLPSPLRDYAAALSASLTSIGVTALLYPPALGIQMLDIPGYLRTLAASAPSPVSAHLLTAANSEPVTVEDGVIQALTDACEEEWSDLGGDLDTLTATQREVAFSTRSRLGRTVVYTVRTGDDIRSVAMNLYGDPETWEDVVEQYGLVPPYVSSSVQPHTLSPGTQLLGAQSRIPDGEDDHLGQTWRIEVTPQGGVLQWDIAQGLSVVSGTLCLKTDCGLRLMTPLGDLPEYPSYGMPEIAGQAGTAENAARQALAAETLLEDARVGRIDTSPKSAAGSRVLLLGVNIVPQARESLRYG